MENMAFRGLLRRLSYVGRHNRPEGICYWRTESIWRGFGLRML